MTTYFALCALSLALAALLVGCEQNGGRSEPGAAQEPETQSDEQQPAQQSGGMGQSRGGALDAAQDAANRTAAGIQQKQNEIDDFLEDDTPPE
jgi:hypothetical protein